MPLSILHAPAFMLENVMRQYRARECRIAVVIPCYKVRGQVLDVIARIEPYVSDIFVVDDKCPEDSGRFVESSVSDPRVKVLYHAENGGVGMAVTTGYKAALNAGVDIVVKVDGDGQMDPALIPSIIAPLLSGQADYSKGNRFYSLYNIRAMPRTRLFGNAMLSFLTKLASGYWTIFDPTNGYTAIHTAALRRLDLSKLARRYFFESDMLIKLGDIRAVVNDVPMEAVYGEEQSNLSPGKVALPFLGRNLSAWVRRICYSYFLRDFNIASVQLVFGLLMMTFGVVYGAIEWSESIRTMVPAMTGTVMIAILPIILGFQLLLGFIAYDIGNEPKRPLQSTMAPHDALPQARSADAPAPD